MGSTRVAVVMAAGKGTRMKTELPKVLIPVRGRPMIDYVLEALVTAGVDRTIVVVGYQAEAVRAELTGRADVEFVLQEKQLGTGHAVMACGDLLADHEGPVLVVAGDSPMMRSQSITRLLEEFDRHPSACILGTTRTDNPTGLGRIIRDQDGRFTGIVEEKDATEEQRAVTEVNMSCYVFDCQELLASLEEIRPDNSQGEYYVTDCPGVMLAAGKSVLALDVLHPRERLSINTLEDLAAVESAMDQCE